MLLPSKNVYRKGVSISTRGRFPPQRLTRSPMSFAIR